MGIISCSVHSPVHLREKTVGFDSDSRKLNWFFILGEDLLDVRSFFFLYKFSKS